MIWDVSFLFSFYSFQKMMHEKNRINVQFGQVSSKFAAVKDGQVSSKFAAVTMVKLAVNLLQQITVNIIIWKAQGVPQ